MESKLLRSTTNLDTLPTIHVTMYLEPIFYETSEILSTVSFNEETGKFETDTNPSRIINGPFTSKGEELGSPIKEEWEHFIDDCAYMTKYAGFQIISMYLSPDSKKSEYFIIFGLDDKPYGKLVYDLRVSDHPLEDLHFPDEVKDDVLKYLKVNKILDGTATSKGIDFKVENVLVGNVKEDTWNRALNRLYSKLLKMRSDLQKHRRTHPDESKQLTSEQDEQIYNIAEKVTQYFVDEDRDNESFYLCLQELYNRGVTFVYKKRKQVVRDWFNTNEIEDYMNNVVEEILNDL